MVFNHVTEEWCKVKEEEFLHCAKKLEFSLNDLKNCMVVDGSGHIERDLACHLIDNAGYSLLIFRERNYTFFFSDYFVLFIVINFNCC